MRCKVDVIIDILRSLLKRQRITVEQLALKNDVSKRTIYRYLDELCVCGIPIVYKRGRNGGIELMNNNV